MKILIPTDFSRNAYRAFEYAAKVFAWTNPEILLVNVQDARYASSMMSMDLNQSLMLEGEQDMKKELVVCKKAYPNLNIRGLVTAGPVSESINEMVEENKSQLVIAGTKGATGATEIFVGSNASSLVDNLQAPLIIVPENCSLDNPQKILLATDFIQFPSTESYDVLLDLCYKNKANLDILHVKTSDSKTFLEDDIPFTVEGLTYSLTEIESDNVEESILTHARKKEVELIATIKSTGGFFHKLFHRSMTKKLSMHTNIPLLILN